MLSSWVAGRVFGLCYESGQKLAHEFQNWTQTQPILSLAWAQLKPSEPWVGSKPIGLGQARVMGFFMTLIFSCEMDYQEVLKA